MTLLVQSIKLILITLIIILICAHFTRSELSPLPSSTDSASTAFIVEPTDTVKTISKDASSTDHERIITRDMAEEDTLKQVQSSTNEEIISRIAIEMTTPMSEVTSTLPSESETQSKLDEMVTTPVDAIVPTLNDTTTPSITSNDATQVDGHLNGKAATTTTETTQPAASLTNQTELIAVNETVTPIEQVVPSTIIEPPIPTTNMTSTSNATATDSTSEQAAPESTSNVSMRVPMPPPLATPPPIPATTPPITPPIVPIIIVPDVKKEEIPRLDEFKQTVLDLVATKKGKKKKQKKDEDDAAALAATNAAAVAAGNTGVPIMASDSPTTVAGSSEHALPSTDLPIVTDSLSTSTPPTSDPTNVIPSDASIPVSQPPKHPAAIFRPPETIVSTADRDRFNYAAFDAGAKLLQTSNEMKKGNAILISDDDRYMMVPCEQKQKYFVIQLSEDIIIDTIELANLEHYASSIKDFQILGSSTHPTEKWLLLGSYTALDSTQKQVFKLPSKEWVRFIKLRWMTYYGSEYFCTLTYFRVYGTTMLETFRVDMQDSEDDVKAVQDELIHIKPLTSLPPKEEELPIVINAVLPTPSIEVTPVADASINLSSTLPIVNEVPVSKIPLPTSANIPKHFTFPQLHHTSLPSDAPSATQLTTTPPIPAQQQVRSPESVIQVDSSSLSNTPLDPMTPDPSAAKVAEPSIGTIDLRDPLDLDWTPPSSDLPHQQHVGDGNYTFAISRVPEPVQDLTELVDANLTNSTPNLLGSNSTINENTTVETNVVDSRSPVTTIDSIGYASIVHVPTDSQAEPPKETATSSVATAPIATSSPLNSDTPIASSVAPTSSISAPPIPTTTATQSPSPSAASSPPPTSSSAPPIPTTIPASVTSPIIIPVVTPTAAAVLSSDPQLLAEAQAIIERISNPPIVKDESITLKESTPKPPPVTSGSGSSGSGSAGGQQSIFKALTNRIKELEIHQALANNYVNDLTDRYVKDMATMKLKMDGMIMEMAAHVARNERQWNEGWMLMNSTAEYIQTDNQRVLQLMKEQLQEAQYFIDLVESLIQVQLGLTAMIVIGYFLGRSLWSIALYFLRCSLCRRGSKKKRNLHQHSKSSPNLPQLVNNDGNTSDASNGNSNRHSRKSSRSASPQVIDSTQLLHSQPLPFTPHQRTMSVAVQSAHHLPRGARSASMHSSPIVRSFNTRRSTGGGLNPNTVVFAARPEDFRNEADYCEQNEADYIDQSKLSEVSDADLSSVDQFQEDPYPVPFIPTPNKIHSSTSSPHTGSLQRRRARATPNHVIRSTRSPASRQARAIDLTQSEEDDQHDDPSLPTRTRSSPIASNIISSPLPSSDSVESHTAPPSSLNRRDRAQTLPSNSKFQSLLGGLKFVAGGTYQLLKRSSSRGQMNTVSSPSQENSPATPSTTQLTYPSMSDGTVTAAQLIQPSAASSPTPLLRHPTRSQSDSHQLHLSPPSALPTIVASPAPTEAHIFKFEPTPEDETHTNLANPDSNSS